MKNLLLPNSLSQNVTWFRLTRKGEKGDLIIVELVETPSVDKIEEIIKEVRKWPMNVGYCLKFEEPAWLVALLSHELHVSRYVAVWSREVNACVVVQTHVKDVKLGERIQV